MKYRGNIVQICDWRVGLHLIALTLFCSCSGSWHLTQALRKDPSLIQSDTLIQIDTVYRTVARVDTIFKLSIDTVIYIKDSVIVKHFYNVRDSTIYIEIDCPDCPEVFKEITLPQIMVYPSLWQMVKKVAWTYALLVVLLVLLVLKIK